MRQPIGDGIGGGLIGNVSLLARLSRMAGWASELPPRCEVVLLLLLRRCGGAAVRQCGGAAVLFVVAVAAAVVDDRRLPFVCRCRNRAVARALAACTDHGDDNDDRRAANREQHSTCWPNRSIHREWIAMTESHAAAARSETARS